MAFLSYEDICAFLPVGSDKNRVQRTLSKAQAKLETVGIVIGADVAETRERCPIYGDLMTKTQIDPAKTITSVAIYRRGSGLILL